VQKVLDPTAPIEAAGEISIAVLPAAARKFNFVPDVKPCLPGDLVLSRAAGAAGASGSITEAQHSAGFAPEHAAWTHAAVFLYDDMVVEAVPRRGVLQRSIYEDVPDRVLRIRRRTTLAETDRLKLALRALSMLGKRYSHWGVIQLGMHLLGGLWNRDAFAGNRHVVICSEVFHDAFAHVTRGTLSGCPVNTPITPAHLSFTPDLEDVDVSWLKLV
jgi:hypothetical protein